MPTKKELRPVGRAQRHLVMGATGGIGSAVCARLAQDGHALALVGRDAGRLEALEARLRPHSGAPVARYVGDFGDAASTRQLADDVGTQERVLDGCVVIYPRVEKPAEAFPDEATWQRNLTTCFIRPLQLLGRVAENLRPGGKVVVVSGIASTQVFVGLSLTNTIRSAWLAQAKTLSFALGRRGLHVNTVSLCAILTDRIRHKLAAAADARGPFDLLARENELNALGRHGRPEDAARAIAQMLGPFADHLSGTNICCDGGYTRHYG